MNDEPILFDHYKEKCFLGCILLFPAALEDPDVAMVKPFMLHWVDHRPILETMIDMSNKRENISSPSIYEKLASNGHSNSAELIDEIFNAGQSTFGAADYARAILDLYNRRRYKAMAEDIAGLAIKSSTTGGELLDEIQQKFEETLQGIQVPGKPIERAYQTAIVPQLPSHLLEGYKRNEWLMKYVEYSQCVSPMSPEVFHESAALWIVSVIIARRLFIPMHFGEVHPNLFIAWIAPTTIFRKTTTLNVARDIAKSIVPWLLCPQDATTEALIADMAGQQPTNYNNLSEIQQNLWKKERDYAGQRGWSLDEMSGLLASAGKDYNRGMLETLMRFYDCEDYFVRSTRGQGRTIIHNAYLSVLGASTPRAMSQYLTAERLWAMGFWPRFAILLPEIDKPSWGVPKEANFSSEANKTLMNLESRLPHAEWPIMAERLAVTLGKDVHDHWSAYNKVMSYDMLENMMIDERLNGTYGRLPAMVLKVATILAALEWPASKGAPQIEMDQLYEAIDICERWRHSTHRALLLSENYETENLQTRILYQVQRNEPLGATLRDIYQYMRNVPVDLIEEQLEAMEKAGDLISHDTKLDKKRGKPTIRYRLPRG